MWDWLATAGIVGVYILLIGVNAAGVVLVTFQLPGTWLILFATGLVAWWQWGQGQVVGLWTMVLLFGLALVGELVECLVAAVGAAGAGASRRGILMAVLGGILGAIVGSVVIPVLILGTLVGAAAGAGVGSIGGDLWSGRSWCLALRGAGGAALGRFGGSVSKLAVAVTMWFVVLVALLWP